jgi:hypothetical protein
MTGDRIKILLLNLPFMLCDLVLPEVFMCSSIYIIIILFQLNNISYTTLYTTSSFPLKVSVKDAEEKRRDRVQESGRRGAATLKRRRLAAASADAAAGRAAE